jgi:polyisoprenoid-binding protein YceI
MSLTVDPVHSHVGFSVRHMMVTTVRGKFTAYRGTLDLDAADFTRSRIEGEIDVASIDTGNPDRDNHLRSADFFDVATHPKITFKSTSITRDGDGYKVTGDLSIRGQTHPVTLDVENAGTSKNPWGQVVTGVSATGSINRKDFGLVWNAVLETGGVAVSDKVKIEIEVQAKEG